MAGFRRTVSVEELLFAVVAFFPGASGFVVLAPLAFVRAFFVVIGRFPAGIALGDVVAAEAARATFLTGELFA